MNDSQSQVCQLFFKDHVVVSPVSKVDKSLGEKPKVAPPFSFEEAHLITLLI